MNWKWPSLGFVAICITYLLVTAFFLWGLHTPDLDRVWTLHHELKTGRMKKLKKVDRNLLLGAMRRHPELTGALLKGRSIGMVSANNDGWIATPTVTILRTPVAQDHRHLLMDVQTPKDLVPFELTVQVFGPARVGKKTKQKIVAQGPVSWPLPAPGPDPEIIIVRLKELKFKADSSMLGIRIQFPTDAPAEAFAAGGKRK